MKPGRFQLRERTMKDVAGVSEMLSQLPRSRRTESGRQR
jgi:hypothetical protein